MATTIAIVGKGGDGKTTVAVNLGAQLTARGKKILLVDIAPTTGLTHYFAHKHSFCREKGGKRHYNLKIPTNIEGLKEQLLACGAIMPKIYQEVHDEIDFLPLCFVNEIINYVMSNNSDKWRTIVKDILQLYQTQNDYDYILIDCPAPSYYLVQINALLATDYVLCTMQPKFASMDAFEDTYECYLKVKSHLNPHLQFLGVVYSMSLPCYWTKNQVRTKDTMQERWSDKVHILKNEIPLHNAIATAAELGRSVRNLCCYRRPDRWKYDKEDRYFSSLCREILNICEPPLPKAE